MYYIFSNLNQSFEIDKNKLSYKCLRSNNYQRAWLDLSAIEYLFLFKSYLKCLGLKIWKIYSLLARLMMYNQTRFKEIKNQLPDHLLIA